MITLKKLEDQGACYSGKQLFKKLFPSGQATGKDVIAAFKKTRHPLRKEWMVWVMATGACAELIEAGADISWQDDGGATALHYAALYDNREAARLLLEAGADVNAEDIGGCPPLHDALENKNLEMAKILRGAGARELKKEKGK